MLSPMKALSDRATQPPRILVVDDDAEIRSVVGEILDYAGYLVISAANGRAALDLVRTHRPDLILLDMRMPIMDGWAFASELAQQKLNVPVVVMTAARDAAASAAQIGASASLAKPFDLDQVLAVVGRFCLPP
jgi:two-component system chemotaxis response regulator CheY